MPRISKGNSPLNTFTSGWEDNIKTHLKNMKFDVVRMAHNSGKIRVR